MSAPEHSPGRSAALATGDPATLRRQLEADVGATQLRRLRELVDAASFDLIVDWLSSPRRSAPRTRHDYTADLITIATWLAGFTATTPVALVTAFDPSTVSAWTRHARAQGWGDSHQRRKLSALRSLLTAAVNAGLRTINPIIIADQVPRAPTSTAGPSAGDARVLSASEFERLIAACSTSDERVVVALLAHEGLRNTDIVNARAEHLDWAARPPVLTVPRQRGTFVRCELTADTARAVADHLAGRRDGTLLVDPATGGTRHRMHPVNVTRLLARRTGISHVTPTVLRATGTAHALSDAALTSDNDGSGTESP